MSLYETIKTEVQGYIADVKAAGSDGYTFADIIPLVSAATMRFTRIAQAAGGTGAEKKEAVLAGLESFYDAVILPIDLPGPDFVVDPALRSLIRVVLGPLIDRVVGEQKAAGIFKD